MEFQQVYVYEFRLAADEAAVVPAPKFFVGLRNALALSLPLWALIAWGIKALF